MPYDSGSPLLRISEKTESRIPPAVCTRGGVGGPSSTIDTVRHGPPAPVAEERTEGAAHTHTLSRSLARTPTHSLAHSHSRTLARTHPVEHHSARN